MANVIKLHKGLNINLKGKPVQEFFDVKQPDIYAIVPDGQGTGICDGRGNIVC